jgi:hypothetical protein
MLSGTVCNQPEPKLLEIEPEASILIANQDGDVEKAQIRVFILLGGIAGAIVDFPNGTICAARFRVNTFVRWVCWWASLKVAISS